MSDYGTWWGHDTEAIQSHRGIPSLGSCVGTEVVFSNKDPNVNEGNFRMKRKKRRVCHRLKASIGSKGLTAIHQWMMTVCTWVVLLNSVSQSLCENRM